MIRWPTRVAQILPLLARYSPEYPCLLAGRRGAASRANEQAFRDKTLHIILETLPQQPRGYNPGDSPQNADNRGPFPYCNLMYKAIAAATARTTCLRAALVPEIQDGVELHAALRQARAPSATPSVGHRGERERARRWPPPPCSGCPCDDVPDITSLLLGPLARGTEVDLR